MMPDRSGSPLLVLVVEDDSLVRLDAGEMLQKAGFDVIEAANAEEAIKWLETGMQFAALFTDIEMPGSMNGLRLAFAVRDRWPPIKIVATSGHQHFKGAELPQGGVFIPKPYTPAQVTKALRDLTSPI
jgi:two-component system, response regulator PdtaR